MSPAIIATLSILVAAAVIDAGLWFTDRKTISEMIWAKSKTYPWIPFAGGLLAGHLFL